LRVAHPRKRIRDLRGKNNVTLVVALLLALYVLDRPWDVVVVVGAIVVEVGEIFFWIWLSKRRRPQVGAETLIGAEAVVVTPCQPRGQVRVAGELWDALCDAGAETGDLVRIVGRRGLTLVVELR
jgi:membrane protein implicated in regulation of membrane protease activity